MEIIQLCIPRDLDDFNDHVRPHLLVALQPGELHTGLKNFQIFLVHNFSFGSFMG